MCARFFGRMTAFRSPSFSLIIGLAALFSLHLSCAVPGIAAPVDRNVQRLKENNATVMIIAGRPGTSMMKIADDLSIVMDGPGSDFRVVPVIGDGATANVRDLILLRNIDLAITDLTVLENLTQTKALSGMLTREVAHVATLFPDKLTILARTEIATMDELAGKRVSVGLSESGSAVHAGKIFETLGIETQTVNLAPPDSAEALERGEIDAFVCFCLSAADIYQRVMFNPELHILPIPFSGELQKHYLPASLGHKEFPSFISKGESVETLAVSLVLVTYNWQKGNPRYIRVEKFVKKFLDSLPQLRQSPRHEGWKSMQVSAEAPSWQRFAAVSEWQAAQKADAVQDMRVAFTEFLDQWSETETEPASRPTEQTKLFEEFLAWQGTTVQQ